MFWSLYIVHGHSKWEPASSRVTYFILRAYTCQYKTILVADVPRVKCKEHGVVT